MDRFAERTGLTSAAPQRRYLWTDAFAVCNWLGLHAAGVDPDGEAKARTLIDAVHHTLGRHRDDDARSGWLSALPDGEAERHPTRGGLRIGKPLPERGPDERHDPRREWDQDGQYYHYLTRWMHALDRIAWHTGDITFNRWARELADTAFNAFSYRPASGASRRMCWKMSIDLSRPLVGSMGHHDPLDGYITCRQLCWTASMLATGDKDTAPSLRAVVSELDRMVRGDDWTTDDPLGLGGLSSDVYRLFQIAPPRDADDGLVPALIADARAGLEHVARSAPFAAAAERRLPFRELGLALGIRALEALYDRASDQRWLSDLLAPLLAHRPLADRLTAFWLDRRHQATPTWLDHEDINEVMLATAIAPGGYLELKS